MRRDEGDAEPGDHRLLDGLVGADLHADARLDAVLLQEALGDAARARARLAHQDGLAGNLLRLDVVPLGERMIGRRDQHLRMLADQRAFDLDAFRRPAHHRHVETAGPERGDGVFAVADDQLDVDAGMLAREGRQHLRREIFRGRDHADRHPSARQRLERGNAGGAVGEHGLDLLGAGQQFAAGGGEGEMAAVALEQRQSGLRLELLHLHGHRRRRDVAGLGGGGEAAAAGRRDEEPELLEGGIWHIQFS